MLDLKMLIVGGLAVAVLGAAGGFKLGDMNGSARAAKLAKIEYDVLYQTSLRVVAERDQCKQEVEKYNGETERLRTEGEAILAADRAASANAVKAAEAAAINASREATASVQRMKEGGDALKKLADTCILSGVPSAYVDVLNSVATGATNRPGIDKVPDAKTDNRPRVQSAPADLSK